MANDSKGLVLSAMMLESFYRRTAAEFPTLSETEIEQRMFERLRAIQEARARLGKTWIKNYRSKNIR